MLQLHPEEIMEQDFDEVCKEIQTMISASLETRSNDEILDLYERLDAYKEYLTRIDNHVDYPKLKSDSEFEIIEFNHQMVIEDEYEKIMLSSDTKYYKNMDLGVLYSCFKVNKILEVLVESIENFRYSILYRESSVNKVISHPNYTHISNLQIETMSPDLFHTMMFSGPRYKM